MPLYPDPAPFGLTLTDTNIWTRLFRSNNNFLYYNPKNPDFGAVGDGVANDRAAIQSCIDATPEGGVIVVPAGVYGVDSPIYPKRNRTLVFLHAPRWQYQGGTPTGLKPLAGFTGSAVVKVADELAGGVANNDGGRIYGMAVNGNSVGTGVHGLQFEGLVRDWEVEHCDVSQVTGSGFRTINTANGYPRGLRLARCSSYSADSMGFAFNVLSDSELYDLLAVSCGSHGIYFSAPGETKLSDSRAVFNAVNGLFIEGAATVGGLQVLGFSTDRNEQYGVKVAATGSQPISFTNLLTRRDGRNANAGGGSFAGVGIIGTAGNLVCPVHINGLVQTVGVDDNGTGTDSPQYGVRAAYCSDFVVGGRLWGVTKAVQDDGSHSVPGLRVLGGTSPTSGVRGSPVTLQGTGLEDGWYFAQVAASETTTQATPYADLTTVGPTITIPDVPAGAIMEVLCEVTMHSSSGANAAQVGISETVGPDFTGQDLLSTNATVAERRRSRVTDTLGTTGTRASGNLFPVDTAGTKTYKLVYKVAGGSTGTFSGRKLWVRVRN